MIRTHLESKAAVTIAALPVAEQEATSCGIMRIQADGRVIDFEEKPKTAEKLERVRTEPELAGEARSEGRRAAVSGQHGHLPVQSLAAGRAARGERRHRFRQRDLPPGDPDHRVQAHLFDGYWEDIGTVGAFHKANIELTRDDPPFDFASEDGPIFTRPRYLPCSRIAGATSRTA